MRLRYLPTSGSEWVEVECIEPVHVLVEPTLRVGINVAMSIPKEVLDRLHRWGDRDDLYADFEDAFLSAYDQDGFTWGERFFYDPDTRKTYQTWLRLEIEEVDPPDDDTCPECGEDLADATDIPDDSVCDSCGWSRSGVRRCIRCGGRDDLVPDDAVCARCRAPGPPHEPGKGGR